MRVTQSKATLIFHSTMVISSIRCPAPANLSMMKST